VHADGTHNSLKALGALLLSFGPSAGFNPSPLVCACPLRDLLQATKCTSANDLEILSKAVEHPVPSRFMCSVKRSGPLMCQGKPPPAVAKPKVAIVSAFRDIGRGDWNSWKRSTEEYVTYFKNLVYNCWDDLIVYVDKETLPLPWHDFEGWPSIKMMDINSVANLFSTKYLDVETEIMFCKEYCDIIPSWKKDLAQHKCPIYNLVNHDKVAFLRHTHELFPQYDYLIWVDFGGIRQAETIITHIDASRMIKDKIVYQAPEEFDPNNRELPHPQCSLGPTRMYGSMFIVPVRMLDWFYEVYDKKIRELHDMKIVDHDQNMVYQVCCDHPLAFKCILDGEWFMLLRRYFHHDSGQWDSGEESELFVKTPLAAQAAEAARQ